MKQGREEEKSSMICVDKVTGHVEGLVMRMERMLTAGDDQNPPTRALGRGER
jgi:hypothetical protein